MKLISFLFLSFFLFSKPVKAEIIFTKFEVLQKTNDCLKNTKNEECAKFILQMEQMQILEFEKSRFKCQSSILGLQSEIIEAYFLKNLKKKSEVIMIPYVFKNC